MYNQESVIRLNMYMKKDWNITDLETVKEELKLMI